MVNFRLMIEIRRWALWAVTLAFLIMPGSSSAQEDWYKQVSYAHSDPFEFVPPMSSGDPFVQYYGFTPQNMYRVRINRDEPVRFEYRWAQISRSDFEKVQSNDGYIQQSVELDVRNAKALREKLDRVSSNASVPVVGQVGLGILAGGIPNMIVSGAAASFFTWLASTREDSVVAAQILRSHIVEGGYLKRVLFADSQSDGKQFLISTYWYRVDEGNVTHHYLLLSATYPVEIVSPSE
jgi:hypothetical protein